MVLATDMTKHFDYLNRFNDIIRRPSIDVVSVIYQFEIQNSSCHNSDFFKMTQLLVCYPSIRYVEWYPVAYLKE